MSPRPLAALALTLVLTAGCLGSESDREAQDPSAGASPDPWIVVKAQSQGTAYEPSLAIDSFGRVYVMAHKGSPTNEGSRLSSWLWYSEDQGVTWKDLPSPAQAHTFLPGIEGDLAIDADDRIYFADTYLGDETLSVWKADADAVRWESSRPIHGTVGVDDRPWLGASGSGFVYDLADHAASDLPSPEGALEGSAGGSRWWFYRSADRGVTWSPGLALGDVTFDATAAELGDFNGMCNLDAERHTPGLLGIVCSTPDGMTLFVLRSRDHGVTWDRIDVDRFAARPGYLFPSVIVRPDGTLVLAWLDEDMFDDVGGRVKLALVDPDGEVHVQDITPFEGSFGNLWLAVSPQGDVLVNVHGDTTVADTLEHRWTLYGLHTRLAGDAFGEVDTTVVDPLAGTARFALGHFIQNAFAPDGSAYVAYQKGPVGTTDAQIFVARLPS